MSFVFPYYRRVGLAHHLYYVLGARELAPFADVLRSIVPIPEAWWQNQMFAVEYLHIT